MARSDAWRVLVIVLGAGRKNNQARGPLMRITARGDGVGKGREGAAAEQADSGLLVSIERECGGIVRNRSSHQAAVIAPGESSPRTTFPQKAVLQVGGLLEGLVMI